MLDERTAASAVVSQPEEPASTTPSQALRRLADLLDGVPGLPEMYITMSDNERVGLQLPLYEAAAPQDRFPAVSRLAQAMGTRARLNPWCRHGFVFEAHGRVGVLHIHVYAPFDDIQVERADADQDRREQA
ncbi:hypothetical protein [Streptomyces sp. NPDC004546]|uniref:hypothetical protein n=1 Tax=Streptomyces sp. NPDC004546 TaxID=3154282 RepID=UPI0033A7C48E